MFQEDARKKRTWLIAVSILREKELITEEEARQIEILICGGKNGEGSNL